MNHGDAGDTRGSPACGPSNLLQVHAGDPLVGSPGCAAWFRGSAWASHGRSSSVKLGDKKQLILVNSSLEGLILANSRG